MIWRFLSALISEVLTLACNGQGLLAVIEFEKQMYKYEADYS